MKRVDSLNQVTQGDVGKFIRLGGKGIMDGLKGAACRQNFYEITSVEPDRLGIRAYGYWGDFYIPSYNWNRAAIIYTKAEIQPFPVW